MKRLVIFFLALFFVISCSEKNENVNTSLLLSKMIVVDSLHSIITQMDNDPQFNFQDLGNFQYGLMRLTDSLNGKTIGDIIELGRKIKRAERIEELKNLANAYLLKSKININIDKFEPENNGEFYRIYVTFKNKSNKVIRSNSGKIKLTNLRNDYLLVPVDNLPLNLEPEQQTTNYFDIRDSLKTQFDMLTGNNYKNLARIEWLNSELDFKDGTKIIIKR